MPLTTSFSAFSSVRAYLIKSRAVSGSLALTSKSIAWSFRAGKFYTNLPSPFCLIGGDSCSFFLFFCFLLADRFLFVALSAIYSKTFSWWPPSSIARLLRTGLFLSKICYLSFFSTETFDSLTWLIAITERERLLTSSLFLLVSCN